MFANEYYTVRIEEKQKVQYTDNILCMTVANIKMFMNISTFHSFFNMNKKLKYEMFAHDQSIYCCCKKKITITFIQFCRVIYRANRKYTQAEQLSS